MGRVLLVGRLAARNLRRRPAEAALLLLAMMAATTVLTLGLVLHGVTDDPYQRTREATAGPDVVASFAPDTYMGRPADLAGLEALADAPGVSRPQRAVPGGRGRARGRRRHRVEAYTPRRGGRRCGGRVGRGARPRGGLGRPARADPRQLGTRRRRGGRGRLRRRARCRRRGPDHPEDPSVYADDAHHARTRLSRRERPLVPGRGCGGHRRGAAVPGGVLRPVLPLVRRSHGRCPTSGPAAGRAAAGRGGRRRTFHGGPGRARSGLAHRGRRPRSRPRGGVPVLCREPEAGRPGRRPGVRRRASLVVDGGTGPGVVAGHPRPGTTSWCRTRRTSC